MRKLFLKLFAASALFTMVFFVACSSGEKKSESEASEMVDEAEESADQTMEEMESTVDSVSSEMADSVSSEMEDTVSSEN